MTNATPTPGYELDVARGMQGLCNAVTHLGRAAEAAADPRLGELVGTLKGAVLDAPTELWAMLFAANHVGLDEVAERLLSEARRAA